MKSTFQRNIPNMRGKRTYTFPCLCCGAIDLRGQYDARLAEKEMREPAGAEAPREYLRVLVDMGLVTV